MMSKTSKASLPALWPLSYWPQSVKAQSVLKDPVKATVYGLSYQIDTPSAYDEFSIIINGWEYSISNESREYPVLSCRFILRDGLFGRSYYDVRGAKLCARPLPLRAARHDGFCRMIGDFLQLIEGGHVVEPSRLIDQYGFLPKRRLMPASFSQYARKEIVRL